MQSKVEVFGVLFLYLLISGCMTSHNKARSIAEEVIRENGLYGMTEVQRLDPKIKSLEEYSSYIQPRLHSNRIFFYSGPHGELLTIEVLDADKPDPMALWRIYNTNGSEPSSGLYVPDLQSHLGIPKLITTTPTNAPQ